MRILHTMLRVGNLDRSIAFYTEVLGMKLLRRNDYPDGKFTLAFVGYQDEKDGAVLELTYNWGVEEYDPGSGYGHVAIEVDNASQTCELVKQKGGNVIREAGAHEAWHHCYRLRIRSGRVQNRVYPKEDLILQVFFSRDNVLYKSHNQPPVRE